MVTLKPGGVYALGARTMLYDTIRLVGNATALATGLCVSNSGFSAALADSEDIYLFWFNLELLEESLSRLKCELLCITSYPGYIVTRARMTRRGFPNGIFRGSSGGFAA